MASSTHDTSASDLAKPLKIQQLEQHLSLDAYLDYVDNVFKTPISDDDSISESDNDSDSQKFGPSGIYTSKDESREDKTCLFNFSKVGHDRIWLREALLSDSDEEDTDDSDLSNEEEQASRNDQRIKDMLKEHVLKKKYIDKYKANPQLKQYRFYGSGFLSSEDRYAAHKATICTSMQSSDPSASKKRKAEDFGCSSKSKKIKKEPKDLEYGEVFNDGDSLDAKEDSEGYYPLSGMKICVKSSKSKKKNSGVKNIESFNARRRKLWVHIAKKEIGKTQRARSSNHKEVLTSCKRAAQLCMKVCRQKAMQSQKVMKENVWRMKRLTREMQAFWKKYDRTEREKRKQMEKEAEEQRKYDVEIMEAKRQQRKLNFLITQTELYAHFMQKKLTSSNSQSDDMSRILGQLDDNDLPARLAAVDDYDSEAMKEKAHQNVTQAINIDEARVQQFPDIEPITAEAETEESQPEMFQGILKHYQLKGVTWLANLYDQGINGILADEMGLGKTVQSIAFLAHIAEKYSIWGPFLVISPASTLHNWQQEFARFTPRFKVIPYWGTPRERRILRQFWAQKNVHTEEASFHVVITSYQLVVADIKYFNRVKWQYLVLDEAQAIKSSSSVRWKSLLGFQCRNRLLLSGTPVQNSMAELWALLHFIMPTLFDNHEEFAEWFSKDIESHAENKSSIDEKHLSRLHMILKPFMLRRVKKDVENELSDKIELMVYCPLTTRQKLLYSALKKKIRIEDLLHSSSSNTQSSVTSSLMNLVMQFRKVCNHPELFERQEPRVPYHCKPCDHDLPFLVFNQSLLHEFNPEASNYALRLLNIHSAKNVHLNSLSSESYKTFSFIRFLNITPSDVEHIHTYGASKIWELEAKQKPNLQHKFTLKISKLKLEPHEGLPNLIFTKNAGSCINNFGIIKIHSMPETLDHRILRSSKTVINSDSQMPTVGVKGSSKSVSANQQQYRRMILPEFKHVPKAVQIFDCQPLELPKFLSHTAIRIDSRSRMAYCNSRRAANTFLTLQSQTKSLISKKIEAFSPNLHEPWGSKPESGGLEGAVPTHGWSSVLIPDKQSLISDAGKLSILDGMLHRLKSQGHRVLVYSQMTKMIDLLEEFLYYRKHTYMRLDGSSKISERRDMVADFQNREDIFVFLLSTRAGGLGINLTAADTVIFYDSDWNPTVDQQAMDRAHRLGQTKQVTVYRLICKDTIEERILQRAQEKSEIQRMVISGGSFKPDTLKPTEVVSLLLDDAEIERKYRQKQAERRTLDERKTQVTPVTTKAEPVTFIEEDSYSLPDSPALADDDYEGNLIVDIDASSQPQSPASKQAPTSSRILSAVRGLSAQQRGSHGRTRGRPRGSRSRGRPSPRTGQMLPSPEVSAPTSPCSSVPSSPGVRRGPGRPRIKPYGPSHQGGRKGKKGSSPDGDSPTLESDYCLNMTSSSSREVKEREFKAFNAFLQ